jgi:ABC-2 type transport system permease protein
MGIITSFISKFIILFKMEWAVMLAYRSESVIWMLGAFIQPLVSLAVWVSISGGGEVAGYSAYDYVLYFLGVMLIERLTRSWDVWELDKDIREGAFSAKLLRPFHPIYWNLASNFVYKTFFAFLMIPGWLILALIFPALRLPIDAAAYGAVLLAVILSSGIRFLIGYEFGLLALWTNRATAIYMLYEGIHLFMSGRIAPLAMFPEWLSEIAFWLPFYPTVGFPVELLMGRLAGQPGAITQGFALQLFWLVVFYALFRLQWRSGLKKYGAVGG